MKKYFLFFLSLLFFLSPKAQNNERIDQLYKKMGPQSLNSHFGFLAGIWFPLSNLQAAVGAHPSFGVQGGFRYLHSEFDLTLNFRFLKTPTNYTVYRQGSLYDLNNYFGGYLGFDYKYYLLANRFREFGLLLGIGYDGFDISEGEEDYLKPLSIGSLNVNTGIRLNFYPKGKIYFSLQGRYNIIHYKNNGGTSFDGNAFSLDLFVGGWWPLR